MTQSLFLVRHGEAVAPDLDPNQPLSDLGREETEHVAHYLKGLDGTIDEIIHSVKLRAKQTAEILGGVIAPDVTLIEREGMKPMDPVDPLLDEIRSYDRNVMLVGHLPFMEHLVAKLLLGEERGGLIDFCGSCVVCLTRATHTWTLNWIVNPKLVVFKQHA